MRYLKRSNSYKIRGPRTNIRQPWSADINSLLKENFAKIPGCTPLRKPYRYNKIFVTENTESESFCMEKYSEKYTIVV